MSINAVEAYTLDSFSVDSIKSQLVEANKIANGSGSELDIAEAKIEIEVWFFQYLALVWLVTDPISHIGSGVSPGSREGLNPFLKHGLFSV